MLSREDLVPGQRYLVETLENDIVDWREVAFIRMLDEQYTAMRIREGQDWYGEFSRDMRLAVFQRPGSRFKFYVDAKDAAPPRGFEPRVSPSGAGRSVP